MGRFLQHLVALTVAGGLLASCGGPQLIGLNTDLTNLSTQRAQLQAEIATGSASAEKREAAMAHLASVEGDLERLTDAAYNAARQSVDAKSKISYYRIAATAGWQRADTRSLTIASEGSAVCDANAGFELSPRDCVMLLVIPDLIVNDSWGRRLGEIRLANSEGLAGRYGVVATDLLDAYVGLDQAQKRAAGTGAAVELGQVIGARQKSIGQNIGETVARLHSRGTGAGHFTQMQSICNAIRSRAPQIVPAQCKKYLTQTS
jgi:hypothetical protein